MRRLQLSDASHTQGFGQALAQVLLTQATGAAVALEGNLGAGKTTLVRALIQALGHCGPVVSPSYTLVEPYDVAGRRLWHLDLYRIGDPEELEYLGWREWDVERNWLLAEWPEKAQGFLPVFDLSITLRYVDTIESGQGKLQQAGEDPGRQISWQAGSERGEHLAGLLDQQLRANLV